MKKLLFIFLMLTVLTGCHGLRMGVGLKGEFIDEDTLVLDGDTFTIQERIGDSLFIVWNYEHSDEKTPVCHRDWSMTPRLLFSENCNTVICNTCD